MSKKEKITCDRINTINEKLKSIDDVLDTYFENYNLEQLERVINKVDGVKDENKLDNLNLKHYNSRDINEFIELCNHLWMIKGLINEINNDSNLFEKLDNFKKLESKLHVLKQSIEDEAEVCELKIINELDGKIEEYKGNLRNEMTECFEKYVSINTASILISTESNNMPFDFFLKQINGFYSDAFEKNFKLTKMFTDWLENTFLQLDDGKSISFEDEEGGKTIRIVNSDKEFLTFARTIENVILFMNEISKYTANIPTFSNMRLIIGKLLLREIKNRIFRKENVYPLIIDKLNYDQDSKISSISKLYQISSMLSESGWSQDGICELEFWIDDLTSSWVNNLVDYTIDDIKQFLLDILGNKYNDCLKDENLIVVELGGEVKPSGENKKPDKNDWNINWEEKDEWNEGEDKSDEMAKTEAKLLETDVVVDDEEDGWGNEDDLDLDINEGTAKVKVIEGEEEEEEGWGAWNEEVEISDDELETKETLNAANDAVSVPSYKHSAFANKILDIFAKYYYNLHDLDKFGIDKQPLVEIEELFKHGFKKLYIAYFMMIEADVSHTYKNDILFYNDLNKILEKCQKQYGVELSACYKMNSNYLNQFIDGYTDKLILVVNKYEDSVWGDNDLVNKDIYERSYKFMNEFDLQFGVILKDLKNSISLNTELIANLIVTMIFKSFNIMCNKIVTRNDISSYESNIISEVIDHTILEISGRMNTLNIKIENIQSLVKLRQIRSVLSLSLKDILESFYEAKFYELETYELISLIESLFVDSMQREQTIQEIRTLRENA